MEVWPGNRQSAQCRLSSPQQVRGLGGQCRVWTFQTCGHRVVTRDSAPQRAPHTVPCSAISVLRSLMLFEHIFILSILQLVLGGCGGGTDSMAWGSLVQLKLLAPTPPGLAGLTAELEEKLQRRRALEHCTGHAGDQQAKLRSCPQAESSS